MTRNVVINKEENKILQDYTDCSRAELTTAYNSYNNYIKYIHGDIADFSEYTLNEMRTIDVLERLGYPINKLGTYFYKEVIMNIFTDFCLRNNYQSANDFFDNCTALLDDDNSILYSAISEKDLDVKLSKFHTHIKIASDMAKENREKGEYDKNLYNAIFFGNSDNQSDALITSEIVLYLFKALLIEKDDIRIRAKNKSNQEK